VNDLKIEIGDSNKQPTGMILEIVRMSTEDGPGIRTTVFFKGCSLKCAWCHNPESISPQPQLVWMGNRCIGCRTCLSVCTENALDLGEAGMTIDRNRCTSCGNCAEECPGTALEMLGKTWRVDALVNEVIKDRAYFETSGGGVTLSGGDPGFQSDFAGRLLKSLREKGLHTAVDTCGYCAPEALDRLLPYAAMVLFDVKLMDPEAHRRFTGHANTRILENLRQVADYMRTHLHPRELWIRTPIIPGATASMENITAIGKWISANIADVVTRWDLCAFNNLCRDKYRRLDLQWPFHDAPLLEASVMEDLAETARQSGVNPDIVFTSGATRLQTESPQRETDDVPAQHV
jgi:pyruvate formate lyase activating enzyme